VKHLEIYIDGASKGNPGLSGIGVVICQGSDTVKNLSEFIGTATNNVAEYTALIYALQEALILKADTVRINTDSQLMHRQINRIYKIKNAGILKLYNQAAHIMDVFKKVDVVHISRNDNRGADKLANQAIRKHLGRQKVAHSSNGEESPSSVRAT